MRAQTKKGHYFAEWLCCQCLEREEKLYKIYFAE